MTEKCLDIITQITVELHKDDPFKQKLGTGVLYSNKLLSRLVYVLTAKHCLAGLNEKDKVSLRVYNPESSTYEYVIPVNQTILCHPVDDAGIIIFNQRELAGINPKLPSVFVVDKHVGDDDAVTKGFPLASLDQTSEAGESSLVALKMTYRQELPSERAFQLTTTDDYSENTIIGMSGSGIFIEACEELYINGIFTRFSDEERGKVIYSQRLTSFNELLGNEYKKQIPLTYLGHHGLGHKTFENNVNDSVANLGPRYCQKVNVKTGTARYFDCIAKTSVYYERLFRIIDSWLTEKSYRARLESNRIGHLESILKSIRADFVKALADLDKSVEGSIDFSDLIKRVDDLEVEIEQVRYNLYSDYSPLRESDEQLKKEIEADESRLSEISQDLYTFTEDYKDLKIELANKPYLIIKGEAGCGKSHLMGDMASKRIADGLPTLLFLGSDFSDGTYESTITSKIGFAGTFPEFLSSFNQIGCQVGSRALLMIDALNEGKQANLWKDKLSGLIHSIDDYPAIGLIVSVRDTYFDDVIPDDVESKSKATILEHKGFKGLEYEAVKQFCLAYKLNLPNVPILTPEFCNPLFLKIVCDTLEASGEKDFPKGFNGVSSLFNCYFRIQDKQFGKKRPEYKYRKVVSSSVKLLALPIFEAKYNLLRMQDADRILHSSFPSCPSLLADLIDNNILLKTKSQLDDGNEDYVVYCYQRISDFVIAGEIVKKYKDWESFVGNVNDDKNLRSIIVAADWEYKGILEAFAILIPEAFGHEIIDIIRFIPSKIIKRQYYYSCLDFISEALINSLNWRSIESINKEEIGNYLNSGMCSIESDVWYNKLAELSAIPNHPFNADYFHALMMRLTMPKRDGIFQFFFNGCAGYDDEKCANPLRRLIDWAWSENVSANADTETTRLTAIMLCWLLSSTYIKHRDEATKALVNLLSEKVDVLIDTMRTFENVDDMYVYERLFAVAYGVALRTSSGGDLRKLGRYVYDTIFKHNNPPKDILLRDHARNIIEYACYKEGMTSVNMRKVRPPYSSILPKWPTDEEVEYLHISYDAPDYKERQGSEQNLIWESVKGGLADFWNKSVSSDIEHFYPISIAEEKAFNKALRLFKGNMKVLAKCICEGKAVFFLNGQKGSKDASTSDKLFELVCNETEKLMSEEQIKALYEVLIPFKVKELPLHNHYYCRFPTDGVRNWLVKRAYDLGFDVELHGRYDRFAKSWTFRNSDDRIDRVGKKYQWIAFHEVMGILADNYKFRNDYVSESSEGYELFHGTWQSFLRNINPSMISRELVADSESSDDGNKAEYQQWYRDEKYDNWDYPGSDEAWTSLLRDLPDPISMIQKVDDSGTEWLTLNNSKSWDEPKDIGKEKYHYKLKRHSVAIYIDAILVKLQDVEEAIRSLDNRSLWGGNEFPSDDWQYLINREKYWSPAYKDVYRSKDDWADTITGLNVPFIYTSEKACGHIEGDKSGTINSYSIPCRRLFEGLEMEYDAHDGRYIDKNGNLIAITYGYDQILVRKEPLLQFLEQSGLAILWLVRGEKMVFISGGIGCLSEYNPCGIYYLDNYMNPKGVLKTYKRV